MQAIAWGDTGRELADSSIGSIIRIVVLPLRFLMAAPSWLFLAALTAMLLRHPDVAFYQIDRFAFALLVIGVAARAVVLRDRVATFERISWPMLGLTLLAVGSVISQPFDHEVWSLLASKFIVPFTLFHICAAVFRSEKHFRHFEVFAAVVLAYLSFTAIAFLTGAHFLIFPRFILDASIGFHADRARGPLLQAVANGVSLNVLGLLVFHAYRRGSLRGVKIVLLLLSVPLAILATMTRAVWLAFAGSVVAVVFLSKDRKLRAITFVLAIVIAIGLAVVMSCTTLGGSVSDRLEERGPLDYREAVYQGGWEMFLERPLTGWGFHRMPDELPRHVGGYHEKVLYPHNTYLELAVEHGLLGLGLYVWIMWELWRLGKSRIRPGVKCALLSGDFRRMWPILLGVYWINASMVVMSYQFVNGLIFTLAGMLAAQRRCAAVEAAC